MELYKPVIVRKEVDDTHYYYVDDVFVPSVTKILDESLPMPFALRQWIGDIGNEKAEEKLNRAGERGTALHNACETLLAGGEINLKEDFLKSSDKKVLVGFVNWVAEFQPIINHIEITVASQLGYAGTLDIDCDIDPEIVLKKIKYKTENSNWIIDIKSSSAVYDSHKLQVAAYRQAKLEMTGVEANMGILHLNTRVQKGWTFHTDLRIGDKPVTTEDFMCAFNMYKMVNGGTIPEPNLVDVYPERLSLKGADND